MIYSNLSCFEQEAFQNILHCLIRHITQKERKTEGLTDYITQPAWSDILTVSYGLVDYSYQTIRPGLRLPRRFSPQGGLDFSDSEVVTITFFAKTIFGGDEDKTLHFIRQ